MENRDEPKGRNHPGVKKLEQELIKRFPILAKGNLEAFHKFIELSFNKKKEHEGLIKQGKKVLSKKFDGINLPMEKIWEGVFDEMAVADIVKLTDGQIKKLVFDFVKNERDSWLQPDSINEPATVKIPISTSEVEIIETKKTVENYLLFMKGTNPKNNRKIIDNDAIYVRLIEYTNYLFTTKEIPNKLNEIGKINLTKGEILYTFYRMYTGLYPNEKYPPELFLFLNRVFAQLKDKNMTRNNYKELYCYKKFAEKPKNYDALILAK